MNFIMIKPKAINCKRLVAFVLPIMGNTTYVIGVHFSKESKDTLDDKMKRLMRDDVKTDNF